MVINGEPLDPDRMYRIGTMEIFRRPRHLPMVAAYYKEHEHDWPVTNEGPGLGAVELLIEYSAARAWESLAERGIDRTQQRGAAQLKSALRLELGFVTHAAEDALVEAMARG